MFYLLIINNELNVIMLIIEFLIFLPINLIYLNFVILNS
jgi:hypothetical protein